MFEMACKRASWLLWGCGKKLVHNFSNVHVELNKIIKRYLEAKDVDYAILVNGAWGSGKTYYIKNELIPYVEALSYKRATVDEENTPYTKKYNPIYISLYGVSSSADFKEKVFTAMHKWAQNKIAQMVGVISKKFAELNNVSVSMGEFYPFFPIEENDILIFDDLERKSEDLTIVELMSFINYYVEHTKAKVIIFTNEDYCQQDCEKAYSVFKEKTIRFTYQYHAKVADVYDSFINKIRDIRYQKILANHKNTILDIFERGGKQNLRTLQTFINLYEIIYSTVEAADDCTEDIHKSIISVLLIYVIENKDGHGVSELRTLQPIVRLHLNNNDDSRPKTYAELTEQKYGRELYAMMERDDYLITYVATGHIDKQVLQEHVLRLQAYYKRAHGTEHGRAIAKLWDFSKVNDAEALSLMQKVLGYVQSGAYTVYELLQAYVALLRYDINGFYKFRLLKKYDKMFFAALDEAAKTHQYNSSFEYQIPILDPHESNQEFVKRYEPIRKYAIQINDRKNKEEQSQKQEDFLQIIEQGNIEGLQQYCVNGSDVFHLEGVDWNRIIAVLENGENPMACALSSCLDFLLRHNSVDVFHAKELEPLQKWLTKYMSSKNGKIRQLYFKELQKTVDERLRR